MSNDSADRITAVFPAGLKRQREYAARNPYVKSMTARHRLLFLILASFCTLNTLRAQTAISGDVTQDATWSGSTSIQGTVRILPGVTVTIQPGATMLMKSAAVLRVRGRMLANGTLAQPIRFTRETTGTWKQLIFEDAADSKLNYCTIEYANSAGTHLDYYDNDCSAITPTPPRNYHEAVVAISTHLDIENCLFRNLPDSSASAEGDAIAIISDDPQIPGPSTAYINNCRFDSIGQGIHSRFSYLLVENCYFTNHHGDNDDIDMYGESMPPPMIRFNTFANPAHDDMINPTRCSAIIMNNVVFGGDDHGIVLRDACSHCL